MENSDKSFHPAYFETLFTGPEIEEPWPVEFAIITAFARTGTEKSLEENLAADAQLEAELRTLECEYRRLTGFSPDNQHAEPGWAVALSFDQASDIGETFDQDAIYFVIADELYVSHCDRRRRLNRVGNFRERLRQTTVA